MTKQITLKRPISIKRFKKTCSPFKSSMKMEKGGQLNISSVAKCGDKNVVLNFGRGGIIGIDVKNGTGKVISSARGFDQDKKANILTLRETSGRKDAEIQDVLKSAFKVNEVNYKDGFKPQLSSSPPPRKAAKSVPS